MPIQKSALNNQSPLKLCRKEVLTIQNILAENWGIKAIRSSAEWDSELKKLPEDVLHTYYALNDDQADFLQRKKKIPKELEHRWYEFLGTQPIAGIVHSRKYPFILDSAVFVVAICRALGFRGRILDIGCHLGYHLDVYARLLEMEAVGVDMSSSAINTGKTIFGADRQITLIQGDVEEMELPKAQVITCIDAFPKDRVSLTILLTKLKNSIGDDGIIVLGGDVLELAKGDIAKACNHVGLGLLAHDVTGGWVGPLDLFDNRLLLALAKINSPVPRDLFLDWGDFKFYANATSTPWNEKTQAFFRSVHT